MNKVIDKGFRSRRFVSTIVKHPVYIVNGDHKRKFLYFSAYTDEVSQPLEA